MYETTEYYEGSRAFTWLANLCGLSVDLVNFLICQISALFLGSLFRSILHPCKVHPSVRHALGLTLGMFFGYFCFGQQAIHIAGLPAICYVVIRTQNPEIVQRTVMIVALFYLLCVHLHRQIYDYGSYSLDITGPLMIITQKVTSLAFSIHDGFTSEQKYMTKAQQYHAVRKVPSPLEFFSYVLHFQGIMVGPMVFYKDYIDFIEGYNLLQNHPKTSSDIHTKKEIVLEPSPTKTVVKKVAGSAVCALIFMKFVTLYPIKVLNDDEFINGTNILQKMWYIMIATTIVRFKYYHAWLLSDAICNNSGLGFTGYNKDGSPKWDLLSNIHVISFEFATNMRDAINNWNIGTNRWLRTIVYERVPKKYGTILTFTLSAFWHGFYPGYYVTFATGALMVTAARSARRILRHRFQETQLKRICYDILTCLTTRIVMAYTTFPFVLLELMGSLRMYLSFFMCLHITAFVVIFIFPKNCDNSKKNSEKNINNVEFVSAGEGDNNCKKQNIRMLENGVNIYNSVDDDDIPRRNDNNDRNECTNARYTINVQHDECEMDNFSSKLKEKIELETRNIEEFIDKTVSGIVELKDDLMRLNDKEKLFVNTDSRINSGDIINCNAGGTETTVVDTTFLKKEIKALNAVVQQANVLPAVLSNGHAK